MFDPTTSELFTTNQNAQMIYEVWFFIDYEK